MGGRWWLKRGLCTHQDKARLSTIHSTWPETFLAYDLISWPFVSLSIAAWHEPQKYKFEQSCLHRKVTRHQFNPYREVGAMDEFRDVSRVR
jgi:hypothetical protein